MIKKIICLLVITIMLSVTAFGVFVDMPENETEREALVKAVETGLLNGVSETEVAPYAPITRSQMGAILVRAMGATNKADISMFEDVSPKAWYYNELSCAVAMGAFQGDGGKNIYPDKNITYQEAFLVLSRVFDLRYKKADALKTYPDVQSVAGWANDGVEKIVSGGYYDGKMLNPTQPINRVEFAKVMNNLVKTYIDEPGTYSELPEGNILVRCNGVVLDEIKNETAKSASEGSLIIIGDGVKEASLLNADGANVVVRGGNLNISGYVGIVRAVVGGVVLSPVSGSYGAKVYPDGSKGVISAAAEGSYISLK